MIRICLIAVYFTQRGNGTRRVNKLGKGILQQHFFSPQNKENSREQRNLIIKFFTLRILVSRKRSECIKTVKLGLLTEVIFC